LELDIGSEAIIDRTLQIGKRNFLKINKN
jgi:hypothetical protein